MQSESIAKLSEALAKAQGEMGHAQKAADNPFFKSKYADLPAVIDAARSHLSKYGLSVIQVTDFTPDGISLITQLNHSSGEWIRGSYPVRPVKQDPQGFGSALTYARRYAYQSMVGIATSLDDDDGNAASGNSIKPESAASQQRKFNAFVEKAKTCVSPSAFLTQNRIDILEMKDSSPEPDLTMVHIVKALTIPFLILLESCDDPAELSGKEQVFLDTLKKYYELGHKELLSDIRKRKEELEQK